ncbi:MAG TPA: sigma 54 modulation/S30EA ribosomal C-terminal domain-containing protein, partial [Bacillota bacterium]|nr:sigma 54 modulation/S30EA ribosomal C-terminal domain-containing protein [Bacillota bacterium]
LDSAVDVLVRQIRKNRTRLEKNFRKDSPILPAETPADTMYEEDEIRITKYKRFEILPMSPEEAVMQMNLLSHQFYLFRNTENGAINVVYKRKDDEYGIIEPTE